MGLRKSEPPLLVSSILTPLPQLPIGIEEKLTLFNTELFQERHL